MRIRLRRLGACQLFLIELARRFHAFVQWIEFLTRSGTPTDTRNLQSRLLSQFLNCVGKRIPAVLHQECYCGAVRAAAEAMVETLAWADRE